MQKHMFPAWCVDSVDDVFPILSRLPTFLSAEGLLLGNGMEWDGMGWNGGTRLRHCALELQVGV